MLNWRVPRLHLVFNHAVSPQCKTLKCFFAIAAFQPIKIELKKGIELTSYSVTGKHNTTAHRGQMGPEGDGPPTVGPRSDCRRDQPRRSHRTTFGREVGQLRRRPTANHPRCEHLRQDACELPSVNVLETHCNDFRNCQKYQEADIFRFS